MGYNDNIKAVNFEVENIDFSNTAAVHNIIAYQLSNLGYSYNLISVNVSLTLQNTYSIIAVIEVFKD